MGLQAPSAIAMGSFKYFWQHRMQQLPRESPASPESHVLPVKVGLIICLQMLLLLALGMLRLASAVA